MHQHVVACRDRPLEGLVRLDKDLHVYSASRVPRKFKTVHLFFSTFRALLYQPHPITVLLFFLIPLLPLFHLHIYRVPPKSIILHHPKSFYILFSNLSFDPSIFII